MSNKSGVLGHENVRGMDIATPNNPRSNLFPAIVTMAAMAVAAVAGYWFMPRADIALPLVEGCRLDREACTAGLPDGGRIEVALEPKPVPTSSPMRVVVRVEGLHPEAVAVSFQGVDMNMGLHRLALSGGSGRFVGETTLPVCVTGRMIWQATVALDVGRKDITVPFRFESGH